MSLRPGPQPGGAPRRRVGGISGYFVACCYFRRIGGQSLRGGERARVRPRGRHQRRRATAGGGWKSPTTPGGYISREAAARGPVAWVADWLTERAGILTESALALPEIDRAAVSLTLGTLRRWVQRFEVTVLASMEINLVLGHLRKSWSARPTSSALERPRSRCRIARQRSRSRGCNEAGCPPASLRVRLPPHPRIGSTKFACSSGIGGFRIR